MKVYLQMHSGNVQQNPLCVESCFTKEYSISPCSRQRCLIPMKIQYYSYEHTFVQQYSMRRQPWVRMCSRERQGMHNGNVQQNPLCATSCSHLSPVLAYVFLSRGKSSTVQCTVFFYTPAQVDAPIMYSSIINRLYAKNPVFEIVHEESVKVYHLHMYNGKIQQNSMRRILCH